MSNDLLVSFLVIANTSNGETTFEARSSDERINMICGPITVDETRLVAGKLSVLAQDGYVWQFDRLAKIPNAIPHTEGRISCCLSERTELGFQKTEG